MKPKSGVREHRLGELDASLASVSSGFLSPSSWFFLSPLWQEGAGRLTAHQPGLVEGSPSQLVCEPQSRPWVEAAAAAAAGHLHR